MAFGWDDLTSIGTGGIFGGGGTTQDAASLLSGYGPVAGLLGAGGIPNNYDAKAELAKSEGMATDVYGKALDQYAAVQGNAAPTGKITAPTNLGIPKEIQAQQLATPNAITADRIAADQVSAGQIATPGTLGGQEASDLRAQRLAQAAVAANSPSAANAQLKAGMGAIAQQQMGQANMARGADRASARRDAMLATGTQGMQAANTAAALAATEQAQKQQAYTAALSNVQASDVNAAQAQTQIGATNLQAQLAAQTANQQAGLAAQTSNQQAGLAAQTTSNAQALQAGLANQGANLQAQTTNVSNQMNTGQFNAGMNMTAQQASANNALAGWTAQQSAQNAALGTGLQAVGAQNQAQGVASGYGQSQNQAATQNKGALVGAAGGIVGGLLSDEDAKTDVTKMGTQGHEQMDFLAWQPSKPEKQEQKGLLGTLSDERAKQDVGRPASTADKATAHLQNAFGLSDERVKLDVATSAGGGPIFDDFYEKSKGMKQRDAASLLSSYENLAASPSMPPTPHNREWADFRAGNRYADFDTMMANYGKLKQDELARGYQPPAEMMQAELSDEQAKTEVDQMGAGDLADFAERVPLATYRYKPGIPGGDDGEDYHAGTLAQSLESTGPLGRLMVHERGDGMKEVEYGPLGLAVGKGALAEAKEAKAIAQAALAKAGGKAGR